MVNQNSMGYFIKKKDIINYQPFSINLPLTIYARLIGASLQATIPKELISTYFHAFRTLRSRKLHFDNNQANEALSSKNETKQ